MTTNLFLIIVALAAGFGGATWARLKRARSDLADVATKIDVLQKIIRSETGRLVLIAAIIGALVWLLVQGG